MHPAVVRTGYRFRTIEGACIKLLLHPRSLMTAITECERPERGATNLFIILREFMRAGCPDRLATAVLIRKRALGLGGIKTHA